MLSLIRLTTRATGSPRAAPGASAARDTGALGDDYTDRGLVFTATGAPVNPSHLRQRSFARLLRKAGLPHVRFHDLRHTCAALLLGKQVHPRLVQDLLVHATVAITPDTYSHAMPGRGDQTARATQGALP